MSDPTTVETSHIDVAYVARLARLALADEEVATFRAQLDGVLDYVRKIGELDVDGIEPTSHARPLHNVMRPDASRPGLDHAAVMRNAPRAREGLFIVPKIVE